MLFHLFVEGSELDVVVFPTPLNADKVLSTPNPL